MKNEIVTLNVPNAPALQVSGEYVILKPFCESIGIDYEPQRKRLERMVLEGSATTSIMEAVGGDGKNREMVGIHKDDFRLWLLGIDTGRLKNREAAELVITYKREVKQVLKDYFERGAAFNQRIITDPFKKAELLRLYVGLLPEDRVAKFAEINYARAIGESPEIDPQEMPLYVENYLEEEDRKDISPSGFGRKLANLYRVEMGEEPPVEPAQIHGRIRNAKAYKESHRPLFDQVLATYPAK